MTAYDDLMAFQRETEALGQIAGRLGWDQETMMPRGAAAQRGEEMAAIEGTLHARRIDTRVGDWLEDINPKALDEAGQAQLREIARSYHRTKKVPASLAAEIARACARCFVETPISDEAEIVCGFGNRRSVRERGHAEHRKNKDQKQPI